MDLQSEILTWILEETLLQQEAGKSGAVSIHYLLVKTALSRRSDGDDLTASVELSLQVYDRVAIYRSLREAYKNGLIQFVDENAQPMKVDDRLLAQFASGEKSDIRYVALTAQGRMKAEDSRQE
jgi:hypothetical protein